MAETSSRPQRVGLRRVARAALGPTVAAARRLRRDVHRARTLRLGWMEAPPVELAAGQAIDLGGTDELGATTAVLDADAVILTAESGARIPPDTVEMLIVCEQRCIPTILLVRDESDLRSSTAAVVSHVGSTDPELTSPLVRFAGEERTVLLRRGRVSTAQAWRLMRDLGLR